MPTPASSSGSGAGATVFSPPGQGNAASGFWQAIQPMINTGAAGENIVGNMGPPSASAYQNAYPFINRFLAGSGGALPQGGNQALNAAQEAARYDFRTLFPQTEQGSRGLDRAAMGGLPYGADILKNAFSPEYGRIVGQAQNNPYAAGALAGAQQGAGMGAAGANQLQSAGMGILNAGFDPQSALFNRQQGQLLDQANVANSMSGIGGTPYGASVTSNALGNFDINWQNGLLNREATAAGAASPLFQAAPGLATSSAAMPTQAFGNNLASILASLNARNTAGAQGGLGFTGLLGGAGAGLGQANTLGTSGANTLASLGGLPYNTGATMGSNALSGLTNLANLGNSAFTGLPQQSIQDVLAYLGAGQNASNLSGQLGQMGMNQLSSGIGGGLSGANMLFGQGGMFPGALGNMFSGAGLDFGGGGLGGLSTDAIMALAL
jgi:hypothetical protein